MARKGYSFDETIIYCKGNNLNNCVSVPVCVCVWQRGRETLIAGGRSACKSKQGGSTEQYYSAAIITELQNVHSIQTAPAEFVCMFQYQEDSLWVSFGEFVSLLVLNISK